jgi:hypothetical protein
MTLPTVLETQLERFVVIAQGQKEHYEPRPQIPGLFSNAGAFRERRKDDSNLAAYACFFSLPLPPPVALPVGPSLLECPAASTPSNTPARLSKSWSGLP